MPSRAAVFRHRGWKERKPWAPMDGLKDRRKRGRAAQRDRAAVLADEPFCREHLKLGKHVQATIVDHIKPLAWGGSDDRSNKQALCEHCHDAKSKAERAAERA